MGLSHWSVSLNEPELRLWSNPLRRPQNGSVIRRKSFQRGIETMLRHSAEEMNAVNLQWKDDAVTYLGDVKRGKFATCYSVLGLFAPHHPVQTTRRSVSQSEPSFGC